MDSKTFYKHLKSIPLDEREKRRLSYYIGEMRDRECNMRELEYNGIASVISLFCGLLQTVLDIKPPCSHIGRMTDDDSGESRPSS